MAMIRIDPDEMTSTASVLRSLAVEVAQIGNEVPGCCSCAMPVATESLVRQLVAKADSVLDEVARRLSAEAASLSQRAGLVANDSPSTVSATGTGSAGLSPASMTIGGGGGPDFVLLNGDGSASASGPGILGGGGSAFSVIGDGSAAASGSMTIGGGSGPAWWREASDREANRIALGQPPNPGLVNALKIQSFGFESNNALIHNILTPSQSSVEHSLGRRITTIDYGRMYPPVSPPRLHLS